MAWGIQAVPISTTVLFDVPQKEIASRIRAEILASIDTRIVTGFMTVGGLRAISAALLASPKRLSTLVVGAATYPAFEALDGLIAGGVPNERLFVHLGHTKPSRSKKHPYTRYHRHQDVHIFQRLKVGTPQLAKYLDNNGIRGCVDANVRTAWGWLSRALEGDPADLARLKAWNLDTGKDATGSYGAWA